MTVPDGSLRTAVALLENGDLPHHSLYQRRLPSSTGSPQNESIRIVAYPPAAGELSVGAQIGRLGGGGGGGEGRVRLHQQR